MDGTAVDAHPAQLAKESEMTITSFSDAWQLIVEKLNGWWESAISLTPNVILALVILIIGLFLAGVIARGARRIGHRLCDSEAIVQLTSGIIKASVILGVLFVALGVLNLNKTVTSLLAGAGIIGLAIGFAFQDLASNFIAGFLMGVRRPFNIGDIIESGNNMGTVVKLNMRNTIIENFTGQTLVIPNKTIFENPLINYHTRGKRRLTIDVGVAYDSDLDQVESVLRQACENLAWKHPEHEVEVWCRSFGASSVDWQVFVWMRQPGDPGYFSALDILHRRIFRALNEAGISIPFPNRTLSFIGPMPPLANARGNSEENDSEKGVGDEPNEN